MGNDAEKIANLEEKAAKYNEKIQKWGNFGRGVQAWGGAIDKVYDRIDVGKTVERISSKLPVRVLTFNIGGHTTPNYQTQAETMAAGLSKEKMTSHNTTVKAGWQKMTVGEYRDLYKDRHGLLNKIDAHFNYTNEGKIKGAARQVILSTESKLITGTQSGLRAVKSGVIDPTADFAMRKLRDKMQDSDQTSQRAGLTIIDNSARAARWTVNYVRESSNFERRTLHNAMKNLRNDTLTGLYESKITKFTRKSELTEAKLNYSRSQLGGLGGTSAKFSHKEKKAAWKTISGNKNYAFMNTRGQKAENMGRSFSEKRTINKMHRAQRKLYGTKLVKTYDHNELTGKTKMRFRRAIDTSKPKKFKRKRPDGVFKSLSKAGAAAIQSRAFHQMAQSDNYGVQAAEKVSRTAFSQVSRLNAKRKAGREKKFYKKQRKAKMQYEKANAKLQVQSSKKSSKKAQKKLLQKKRNAKLFKKQSKAKAAKAAKQALSKKSLLNVIKNKKVALAAGAAALLFIVPLVVFMGGGAGSTLGTVIPVDDALIAFADSYFDNKLKALVSEKEKEIRENNDDVNSVKTVIPSKLKGIKVCTIPAYLSAIHGGEWTKEEAMADIDKLVEACYTTKVKTKAVSSGTSDDEDDEATSDNTSSSSSSSSKKYNYTVTLKCTKKVKNYISSVLSKEQKEDYDDLMEERGGHQSLSPFAADVKKFVSADSKNYYTFPTSSLPEHFTHISGKMDVIASGNGKITGCSDGKLVIMYEEEGYNVTYQSPSISASGFTVGNEVIMGEGLFSVSDGLYLSTYNVEEKCFINPYYIFSTVSEEIEEMLSEDEDDEDEDDDDEDD
ncbi:MAG: hypothetical protein K2J80_12550 [Oscillospiraceae bacterium]|nr:hypothetical protein [Oscillospiraceae bacterium]